MLRSKPFASEKAKSNRDLVAVQEEQQEVTFLFTFFPFVRAVLISVIHSQTNRSSSQTQNILPTILSSD